ncbi:MAG TPA: hypothetical protein VEQ41_08750 [Solirubrobacterales bacterium]|nr:hypothetical protein [Solirubrobacterales bacterium]
MNLKVKRRCLGVIAMLAITALTGANATATSGGHFASDSEHTILKSVNSAQHDHAFIAHSGEIDCNLGTLKHEGTFSSKIVASIDLAPSYGECTTQGGTPITSYTFNGCVYRLTVGSPVTTAEQTIHFVCPTGKALEFHQPNCLATMVAQTATGTVTYKTSLQNGKDALTLELNATFETQYHGGLCVFLGTKQSATLTGSLLLTASNTVGEPVSVIAT